MNSPNKHHTSTVKDRQQSASAAIASVKAEGLSPTASTKLRLNQYVEGKLTADQLYKLTIAEVRTRNKHTVS